MASDSNEKHVTKTITRRRLVFALAALMIICGLLYSSFFTTQKVLIRGTELEVVNDQVKPKDHDGFQETKVYVPFQELKVSIVLIC